MYPGGGLSNVGDLRHPVEHFVARQGLAVRQASHPDLGVVSRKGLSDELCADDEQPAYIAIREFEGGKALLP